MPVVPSNAKLNERINQIKGLTSFFRQPFFIPHTLGGFPRLTQYVDICLLRETFLRTSVFKIIKNYSLLARKMIEMFEFNFLLVFLLVPRVIDADAGNRG